MQENLRLISHSFCPFVQRAAIVLEEKSIPYTRENINLDNPPKWFEKLSPQGKVPVLQVDNKDIVFESSVICEYLDEVTEGSMHSSDALVKAKHRAWMEYGSSMLMQIWNFFTEKDEEIFYQHYEEIAKSLQRLQLELDENQWQGPYFSGKTFHLVDAAFVPVFRYFDTFEKIVGNGWFNKLDKVSQWRLNLKQRESGKGVVSPIYETELLHFVIKKKSHLARLIER